MAKSATPTPEEIKARQVETKKQFTVTLEEAKLMQKTSNEGLKSRVIRHESGNKLFTKAYKDSEGNLTIGHGLRLDGDNAIAAKDALKQVGADYNAVISGKQELNKDQIDRLLNISLTKAKKSAKTVIDTFDSQPKQVQDVLTEMSFQLGAGGLGKFKEFEKAINLKDYNKAADEMLNSKWAQQTPNRAKELAGILKSAKANTVATTQPKQPSVLESLENTAEDVASWAKRAMVKQGLVDPEVTIIKPKPAPINKVNSATEEVKSQFEVLGEVPAAKNSKEDKYFSYYNKFDRNKGFNYLPIKNVGASNSSTSYKNVAGIAHFILDTDLASNTQHEYSKKYVQQNLKGSPIAEGSTVKNPFVVEVAKEGDKVNIKYKQLSEVKDKSKVKVPLRQLRYTDLNWDGATSAEGFKNTVKSIPTKSGKSSHFIFPNVKDGKNSYGKFGGGSVVFLAEGKKFAIDFAGSVNQIKDTAEKIIKQENIKPEQLIIAYHDLGSFSAKPKARKNNTLDFYQWSDFNNAGYTGGGLAIPINK